MTVEDAYSQFLVKMNESATSRGMAVNKGKFAIIFNKNLIDVVEKMLESKGSDEIDKIRELLVSGKTLKKVDSTREYEEFKVPEDYIEYDNIVVIGKNSKGCKSRLDVFPIKGRNTNEIMTDEYNKPSFFYRRAPLKVVSEGIRVYKDNFEITSVNIDYYRYPRNIKLEDSFDPESDFISFKFELKDIIMNKVIDQTIIEYALSSEDYNKVQAEIGKDQYKKQ